MANLQDTTEIAPDLLDVMFGADTAWFHTKASIAPNYDAQAIEVGSLGSTPIAHMLMGMRPKLKLTFIQWTREIMETIWSLTGGANLEPGSLLPAIAITFHNPKHGDDHGADLVFPICNIINPGLEHDGKGTAEWTIEAVVCINPTTKVIVELGEEPA